MQVGLGWGWGWGGGGGADSKSNLLFYRKAAERKQRKVLFANLNFFVLSQGSLFLKKKKKKRIVKAD